MPKTKESTVVEKAKELPKCKSCGNRQVYTRQKKNQRVCKLCGHVEQL